MNGKQQSKQRMYKAVIAFLKKFSAIISKLPQFLNHLSILEEEVAHIEESGEQQITRTTGIKTDKDTLRMGLINLAADSSRRITAFAKVTGNNVLLKETKFSVSELKHNSEFELREKCRVILDRMEANLASLAEYGLDSNTKALLEQRISAFEAASPSTRLGTSSKKQSTQSISSSFARADASLDMMDSLVEIDRLTEPDFYNGYKSVRKLVDTSMRSLMLKGRVVNAAGEPIKGVTITFYRIDNGSTQPVLVKLTAEKGGFYVKSLDTGMYRATFTKPGLTTQEMNIAISKTDLAEVEVKMS